MGLLDLAPSLLACVPSTRVNWVTPIRNEKEHLGGDASKGQVLTPRPTSTTMEYAS
jgi:hypothetical protein